jgi:hypothetical protein
MTSPTGPAGTDAGVKPVDVAGIRFTVASRPQRRFSNTQTVNNTAGGSFQPIQLPATGFVRKLSLFFTATLTMSGSGALVTGDGPWNLIQNITLTDATGQAIIQPISGFNLYLVNKYLSFGSVENTNRPQPWQSQQLGPDFNFASTTTTGTATFRLDLDLEQDYNNGYGCIPNLDSNASLQLKIDYAASTVAFGGTITASTLAVRVAQYYWAPVGSTVGGVAASTQPVGFGDYVETRYETQTVSASAENTVAVTNRGGLIKGMIAISRAAGVRTAYTAATNVGLLLDNNAIDEGIPLEEQQDYLRRTYGYMGTDLTTSYAPITTAGTVPGLDRGVMVWPFGAESGGRDSWLATRVGSLLQFKITPGASATTLEIVTLLAQVKDAGSFYAPSALN